MKKKVKGRILAILMSLAMVFTMMPMMSQTVYADDPVYTVTFVPGEGSGTQFTMSSKDAIPYDDMLPGNYDEEKGCFFYTDWGGMYYKLPKKCTFTAPSDNMEFGAWKINDDTYDPGDSMVVSGYFDDGSTSATITAIWKEVDPPWYEMVSVPEEINVNYCATRTTFDCQVKLADVYKFYDSTFTCSENGQSIPFTVNGNEINNYSGRFIGGGGTSGYSYFIYSDTTLPYTVPIYIDISDSAWSVAKPGSYTANIKMRCTGGEGEIYIPLTLTVPDTSTTHTVTYKVVNGTWSNDETAPIEEVVVEREKPSNIPTGMKASEGYEGGSWNIDPATASITEDTTFTYTFTKEDYVNKSEAATVYMGGIPWRVIGYNGEGIAHRNNAATLLSSEAIAQGTFNAATAGNHYSGSNLQKRIDALTSSDGIFSDAEKAGIIPRTLNTGGYEPESPYTDGIAGNKVDGALLWPLSTTEARYTNGTLRETADTDTSSYYWWLRSPGSQDNRAAFVRSDGRLAPDGTSVNNGDYRMRPALHLDLDAVLFTSAATGDKTSVISGGKALEWKGEYKLTLLDSARKFDVKLYDVDGSKRTIRWTGAETGKNEYLSILVKDNGNKITHYEQLKNLSEDTDAAGQMEIDLSKIDMNGKTLYVFNEQCNGAKVTDYCSALKTVGTTPQVAKYTVTYEIENGTFGSGDKTSETVYDGDKPKNVPTGMTAAEGFEGGSWNLDPATATITGHTTFTYKFVKHTCDWEFTGFTWTGDDENGYTNAVAGYKCKVDNNDTTGEEAELSKVITDPTCTEGGKTTYTATVAATVAPDGVARTESKEAEITEATGHTFDQEKAEDKYLKTGADCTHPAEYYMSCSKCGVSSQGEGDKEATFEFGAPLDHNYGDWEFTGFTWTGDETNGYTKAVAGYKCKLDNGHLTAEEADLSSDVTEPTCTEGGKTTYTATVDATVAPDGKVRTESKEAETTEAIGHSYGGWTKLDDDQHYRECERDKTHVEKANHTWDAGVVTKPATTTATGVKTYTCTACKATKTETIAKLPEQKDPEDPKKEDPKEEEPKKDDPKKEEPKKDDPNKDDPKKEDPNKDDPKKEDPNKDDPKKEDPEKQYGTDGTPVGPGASDKAAEKAITKTTSDKDIKGAKFAPLKLRSTSQGKTNIKLTWTKNKKAVKYVVYGNRCNASGKKYKPVKLATVKGNTYNVKKIKTAKVRKGTYYKFVIVALNKNNKVVSTSKMIHVATKGGKVGNHKSVTVKAKVNAKGKAIKKAKPLSKTVLKKGKSLKLIVKLNPAAKKLKVKKHVGLRYETTNAKVATVSGGKIKAKGKGKCIVYAYAQNGVAKAIKITVK